MRSSGGAGLQPCVQEVFTIARVRHPRSAIGEVVWLSLLAALLVSLVDATLIQIRKEFFTGGFLAVDTATSWPNRTAFAIGSLVSDWALTALLVVAAMGLACRLRLARPARWLFALGAAVLPFAGVVFVQYELAHYLGDAFDLGLMFDLVGRRPSELLAVAAGHFVGPVSLAAVALAGLAGLTWLTHRVSRRRASSPAREADRWSAARGLLLALGLLVLAVPVTAVMRTSSAILDNGLARKPSSQLLGSLVETLTDVDRDGYGLLARPADPNLWDSRVHPYALDIPGNGIDEDGVGGDLATVEPSILGNTRLGQQPAAFVSRPDIVLVMLETFRADALGALVNGRAVTPVLSALAARGVSHPRAYSHNGYTVQSRYHLFAGQLAVTRGTTLLDDFRSNGYEVAWFAAQDESFGDDEYGPGFERADVFYDARQDRSKRYTTFSTPGSLGVTASTLLERVSGFLDRRARTRPLFLYVNLYDTHYPYYHREMKPLVSDVRLREADIRPENVDRVREGYFNAAANVDAAIGVLLGKLTVHLGHEPAIMVLADHGESLFDEGFLGHGHALNDAQTRIPLVVVNLPLILPDPVGQADLRGAIRRALESPGVPSDVGRERRSEPLFQYLGKLHRPKQIAFVLDGGRLIYDFRAGQVGLLDGSWRGADSLAPTDQARPVELVQYWERLRLVQKEHEARTSSGDVDVEPDR